MRVLLDTTYARRAPCSGTAVYLDRIVPALRALGVEIEATADPRRRPPAGGGAGSLRNLATDAYWAAVGLPRRARRHGAQVVHHPLPSHAPLAGVPQVVTVHDLAFERLPDAFRRGYRTYAHAAHRAAARMAAVVVCVSETTAADVRELWRVPAGKIVVAPLGPGQELPISEPRPVPSHLLYIGDAEPRKNLPVLLAAYERYRATATAAATAAAAATTTAATTAAEGGPLPLVLAGSAGFRLAPAPGVRAVDAPGRAELAELLARAAALVHPSLYEGFGMTALEAMRAGVPVIAARSPGIVEVCGDAAAYADPRDPESFARALADVAADPGRRATLSAAGRARAAEFSWAQCAVRHAEAYDLAVRS